MKQRRKSSEPEPRPDEAPARLLELHAAFTGRGWAVDRITEFIRTDPCQLLAVVAKPGAGKSLLAVRVTQLARGEDQLPDKPDIHATHFCEAQVISTLDAVRVLEHLSGQLAATVPGYIDLLLQQATTTSSTQISPQIQQQIGYAEAGAHVYGATFTVTLAERDPRMAFETLLRRPLKALYASGRLPEDVVVMVDGLDETIEASTGALVNLLATELADPDPGRVPGLKWVVFTRPENVLPRLTKVAKRVFDLAADQPEGVDDVMAYALRRLGPTATPGAEVLARRIAQVAAGSFLYAYHVIEDVLARKPMPTDLAGMELPHDLADVYQQFLNRKIGLPGLPWQERFRPVLGALTQARGAGLSRQQLLAITGLSAPVLDDTLRDCGSYLDGDPDHGLMVHHQSLREYLREPGPHHIYPADVSGAILTALAPGPLGQRRWDQADPHILEYGMQYALDAGRTAELITDPGFLVHADPASLLPAMDNHQGTPAPAAASPVPLSEPLAVRIYRSCAHLLAGQSSAARQQVLALFAAQWQDRDLAAAIEGTPLRGGSPRSLKVMWATGSWLPWGQLGVLTGHTKPVSRISLHDLDGTLIAVTTSEDGTARVWDVALRTQRGVLAARGHQVSNVEVGTLNGALVALTTSWRDKVAYLWDLTTCTQIGTLTDEPMK